MEITVINVSVEYFRCGIMEDFNIQFYKTGNEIKAIITRLKLLINLVLQLQVLVFQVRSKQEAAAVGSQYI